MIKNEGGPSIPIEGLFRKINNTYKYSIFSNNVYSEQTLVNTGEIVLLCTKAFATKYTEWQTRLKNEHTWATFQT